MVRAAFEEGRARPRYVSEAVRIFSVINLALWVALFLAWLPYVAQTGLGDRVSVDVMVILVVTAGLMAFLAVHRLSARRHILG